MPNFLKRSTLACFVLSFIFIATNAFCLEELFSFQRQGFEFKIYKENSNVLLKIKNNKISSIEKFALTNPARIIVDITGFNIKKSENVGINNVPLIKAIRLGGHPPYQTRLVVDLKDNFVPSYTTFLNKGELTVLLAISNDELENIAESAQKLESPNVVKINRIVQENKIESPAPKLQKEQITPQPPIVQPNSLKKEIVSSKQDIMKSLQEEKLAKNNLTDQQISNDGNCILSSVYFDNDITGSSISKIALNQKTNFSIKKTSNELYKIFIPNCKLISKSLEHPFFPPPEFKKFIFIQTKEIGDNIEVSVGVEKDTTLNYLQRDSEIWVKPSL